MKRYQEKSINCVGSIKKYNEQFGKYESKMQHKSWTKKFGFSHKFRKSSQDLVSSETSRRNSKVTLELAQHISVIAVRSLINVKVN